MHDIEYEAIVDGESIAGTLSVNQRSRLNDQIARNYAAWHLWESMGSEAIEVDVTEIEVEY